MEDTLISFDIAKLAKEKGYNIISKKMYSGNTNLEPYNKLRWDLYGDYYYASTQSLLQKWLREVHNIHIQIENVNVPKKEKWIYEIMKLPSGVLVLWNEKTSPIFDTYEQALEEGLQEGLKLIK